MSSCSSKLGLVYRGVAESSFHKSCSRNSLKGAIQGLRFRFLGLGSKLLERGYAGDYMGSITVVIKRDTRSLDYRSYGLGCIGTARIP